MQNLIITKNKIVHPNIKGIRPDSLSENDLTFVFISDKYA